MFKEMRRQDRKINLEDTEKILKENSFGVLSTTGDNGYAYGVPLNYVYLENAVYFHSALDGGKLDNIKFNNKVSFCVVGHTEVLADKFSTAYESAIVFGKAFEVEGEEKKKALVALIQKYSKDYFQAGIDYIERDMCKTKVIKISVESISGKTRKV